MTPDEAISAAFRAAVRELAKDHPRPDAYEGFLIASGEHLENAAQALSKIALDRQEGTRAALHRLEMCGLHEIMTAAVSVLLALGHYPYLDRVRYEERMI